MEQVKIRRYRSSDFEAVTKVWFESWNSTPAVGSTSVTLESLQKRFQDELSREWSVHVAARGPDVIGFIALTRNRVDQLFVSPPSQGQGVGKQLLAFAKSRAPAFTLSTPAENKRACKFYEREGLVLAGRDRHPRDGYLRLWYEWRAP